MRRTIIALAALLVLVGGGCFPKCIKSHQATRLVPARDIYSYHRIGKTNLRYKSGTVPAHEESYTVCDEYEKK